MYECTQDTIVAVASPPGHAPRGIVRCSGPDALTLADHVFRSGGGMTPSRSPGFRRLIGLFDLEPKCLIPGQLFLFRAPRSYTREDSFECHVPGAPSVLAMLLERLTGLGARLAQPGEFTARAFLNGGIDLTRAEAVAAAIHARSDAQLRAARHMMTGRFARHIDELIERLAELVALVEADIDFAEEPIEFITPDVLRSRLSELAAELHTLLRHAESTERIDSLPHILLVGRSNAGKSTLINFLSGTDRSICSPVPGTTRDILSATISLGRGQAVLLDAAGVDTDMTGLMRDAAVATSNAAGRVSLICLVVDGAAMFDDSVLRIGDATNRTPRVTVANKIDLLDSAVLDQLRQRLEKRARGAVCLVSAVTGAGIDELRRVLADALDLHDADLTRDAVLLTARQRDAVQSALHAVDRALHESADLAETIDRADILAFELRDALDALAAIVGSVTTDDLLGRVFASFCIGK
ncbi:MAG: GTP-binding protein [Phycisphaerales bacterium]|nr:GTP-binding protein [Phycisphaerales bacterium]